MGGDWRLTMKLVQFKLNLPADVKAWVEDQARSNVRSQAGQIIACLRAAMAHEASEPGK